MFLNIKIIITKLVNGFWPDRCRNYLPKINFQFRNRRHSTQCTYLAICILFYETPNGSRRCERQYNLYYIENTSGTFMNDRPMTHHDDH